MADVTSEDIRKMLDEATPGPWWVCTYDAGDYPWYDHNGPCPSIQAPDECDCAVVHWDGFKQEYWSACDGNQKQIEANARLIAAAPDLAAEVLRLRDELASGSFYKESDIDAMQDEIARLREALGKINVGHGWAAKIALAALGDG